MQASRQPGPEQVVGTGANGWGGPWGLTRLQSPQRPHRHYSHDSGGEGPAGSGGRAGSGVLRLGLTAPIPASPQALAPARLLVLPQRSLVPPGEHGPARAGVQCNVLRSHFQLEACCGVCDPQTPEVSALLLPRPPGLAADELPIY